MARVAVRVGDIELKVEQNAVALALAIINTRLEPKLWEVVQWYREQVASHQYTYFDGYPHVVERMREIVKGGDIKDIARVEVQRAGNRIFFRIRMFEDQPGCWLDRQTPVHGTPLAGGLGWWRFFEFGAPGRRNWGSTRYGFVSRGMQDGRLTGFMAPLVGPGITARRPHPGVYKVGVFEKTWRALRDEFRKRVKQAIQEVLGGK